MTKIIVDKQTAIKAVLKFFDIPICGTEPIYYKDAKLGGITTPFPVMVFFDFEENYGKEDRCQK